MHFLILFDTPPDICTSDSNSVYRKLSGLTLSSHSGTTKPTSCSQYFDLRNLNPCVHKLQVFLKLTVIAAHWKHYKVYNYSKETMRKTKLPLWFISFHVNENDFLAIFSLVFGLWWNIPGYRSNVRSVPNVLS